MRALVLNFLLLSLSLPATQAVADDWPNYGNDPGGSQYSPLSQINRKNVRKLRQVWEHRSGDVIDEPGLAGTNYEVTPIHANDRLYYCTPLNKVFALDPGTGEELWRFDGQAHAEDEEVIPGACRGVAYWAADKPQANLPCQRRIFRGDTAGRLWALDADTGEACADFGQAAGHPGYVATATDFDNHGEGWWFITSPPAVFADLVIVGSALDDNVANANDGILRAFDARTGELRWSFNPVPEEQSNEVGGGNAWSTLSVDQKQGIVFMPSTSLSTDYFGGFRPAESPYANALIALKASTGEPVWHRQLVRHNLFDYDLPGHALLIKIRVNESLRDVAVQQTKTGEIYVFDRETGEPVFPIEDQPAPSSDVPGEVAAETQPRSVAIDPFSRQSLSSDDLFGLSLFDRAWCRREFANRRYEGLFTPPSEKGSIIYPSIRGGGNWGGAAFHPESNSLIVRSDGLATIVQLFKPEDPDSEPVSTDYMNRSLPLRGTDWWVRIKPFLSPLGVPCTPPPWGSLTAISLASGKQIWQVPLGRVRRFGLELPEATAWGSPGVGGPMVTGGGLVFVAAGLDHHIVALDIDDGMQLWQRSLPAPGMAVPMTYSVDGRQFVVIAAGGNALAGTAVGDSIVAFAIPDD